MKYKKNRTMTVIYSGDRNYQPIPTIRLKGKWLEDLGFEIGNKINVECQSGRLIITNADEVILNDDEIREI